jgi:hypothetical protein
MQQHGITVLLLSHMMLQVATQDKHSSACCRSTPAHLHMQQHGIAVQHLVLTLQAPTPAAGSVW